MSEFKKKNKYALWHSPLALIVLFCVFVGFAYNMVGLIKKERETSKNRASELNKMDELRKRESKLSADIDKLNTEEGVEESVRDKFQVVKPGEKEVLIVEDQDQATPTEESQEHGFWNFIKRIFGK